MITPEEFINRWDVFKHGPLNKFNKQDLMDTDFSDDVKRFLSILVYRTPHRRIWSLLRHNSDLLPMYLVCQNSFKSIGFWVQLGRGIQYV